MIKAVKLADNNVMFGAKPEKKENGEVFSKTISSKKYTFSSSLCASAQHIGSTLKSQVRCRGKFGLYFRFNLFFSLKPFTTSPQMFNDQIISSH